jgi:hypothetical protein
VVVVLRLVLLLWLVLLLQHLIMLLSHGRALGRIGVVTTERLVVGQRAVEQAVEGAISRTRAVERSAEGAVERTVGRAIEMTVDGTAKRAVELAGELAIERAVERSSKWSTKGTIERSHRPVAVGWRLRAARAAARDETWRWGGNEAAIDAHVGGAAAKVVQLVKLEGRDTEVGGRRVAYLRETSIVARVAPGETRGRRHGHVRHGVQMVKEWGRGLAAAGGDFLFIHEPTMRLHQAWRGGGPGVLPRALQMLGMALHALLQLPELVHLGHVARSSPFALLSVHQL